MIPHFVAYCLWIVCKKWVSDLKYCKMGKHEKVKVTQFPILCVFDCVKILQYGEWISEFNISDFHCHLLFNLFGFNLVFCSILKFGISSPYYSKIMQINPTKWGSVLLICNMGKTDFLLWLWFPILWLIFYK